MTWGHTVSGSDLRLSAFTDRLVAQGATVHEGHDAANVGDADLVVITSAATKDNPEIVEAQRRGIPVIKRAEMVARLMEGHRSIAVAGTHGKTTTTALVSFMLVEAGLSPTFLVGGDVVNLGTNAAAGEGEHIVVEADEFDAAFLSYTPDVAVVTNIEPDHLDIYGSFEELVGAFAQFLKQVPPDGLIIACADDPTVADLLGRGKSEAIPSASAQRRALRAGHARRLGRRATSASRRRAARSSSSGCTAGPTASSASRLPGRHNVSNALAAIAVGHHVGVPLAVDAEGAGGVPRRRPALRARRRGRRRHRDGRLRAPPDRGAGDDRRRPRALPAAGASSACSSRTPTAARSTCWTSSAPASRASTCCSSPTPTPPASR